MPHLGTLGNLYNYQSIIWYAHHWMALIRSPGDCQFGRGDGRHPVIEPQLRTFTSAILAKATNMRKSFFTLGCGTRFWRNSRPCRVLHFTR